MDSFGFIIHPLYIRDLFRVNKILRICPPRFLKKFLKYIPPYKISTIRISSSKKEILRGYFIACPLLPQQILDLDKDFVLNKIILAVRIAEKLGVKIVGLGGFTSIVGDKGLLIAKNTRVPVTSGNTYTAYSVLKAIFDVAKQRGKKDLSQATAAIVGASGSIGSLCAKKLAYYVPRIILTSRRREKLEVLKKEISRFNSTNVIIEKDSHRAVKEADIVIVTTSTPEAILTGDEFKKGAIVCDVSLPENVCLEKGTERHIFFLKGGIIKVPFDVDLGIDIGLPKNIVFACIAETILLALEKRFECFSLGDNIDVGKLDEVAEMSTRYGFEVVY